jgi:ArsR family transcriptional regulator
MRKTKVTFNNEKLQVSSELMRALAHPLRLKILEFIDKHDTINVNKIYNTLNIEQSITSQHLRILRMAGVVRASRDGKYIRYNIDYSIINRAVKAVNNFLDK